MFSLSKLIYFFGILMPYSCYSFSLAFTLTSSLLYLLSSKSSTIESLMISTWPKLHVWSFSDLLMYLHEPEILFVCLFSWPVIFFAWLLLTLEGRKIFLFILHSRQVTIVLCKIGVFIKVKWYWMIDSHVLVTFQNSM